MSTAIHEILTSEGINLRVNARCIRVSADGQTVTVHLDCEAGQPSIVGSHLLLAVGRTPNTDDLGLEAAGVRRDDRGYIVVDDELRTNISGIWALGDCNGRGAFTHTSYNDFEIVAANLLDGAARRVSDRIPAYALYIDPPLGRAGLTAAEAQASGPRRPRRQSADEPRGPRDRKRRNPGLMKIVVDQHTRAILGAAVLGTGGDEVIHCVLDAMYAKAPYPVLQQAVHIHPTVSELIPTLLGELARP